MTMHPTRFPTGFGPKGVSIRNMPVLNTYSNKVFWVHSVDPGGAGTETQPFATIDEAIGHCTDNRGDIVMVKAGHAETLTAASAITCDVAGVTIVGLGAGTDRPELSFGTSAGASVVVSAANVSILNIVGISAVNLLTNPFHIQAAGCTLDIEWQDPSSSLQAVRVVECTTAADNLRARIKVAGVTSGGTSPVNCIRMDGVDGAVVELDFYGRASTAIVQFVTTACSNIEVYGYVYNSGVTDGTKDVVDTISGSTWWADIMDGAAGAKYSGGSASALAADDVSTVASSLNVPSADSTANTLMRDVAGNKTDAAVTTVGTTKSIVAYVKGLLNQLGTITNTGGTATIGGVLGDVANVSVATSLAKIGTVTNTGGTATIGAVLGDFANTTLVSKLDVPSADATSNVDVADVAGNKTDAAVTTVGTTNSILAYIKGVLTWIGTITNTGGTATVGAVLGDFANTTLISKLNVPSADATANVNVADVAGNKTDAAVTAVGTTKSIQAYAKGLVTMNTVQSADSTDNAFAGDVIGNKTDAAQTTVGTTRSIIAYVKGLLNQIGTITNTGGTATIGAVIGDFANTTLISKLDVPSADATANVDISDVLGNKSDAAQPVVGTTRSLTAYMKGLMNSTERTIVKTDGNVLTGDDDLFTVSGGPIMITNFVGRVTTVIGGAANLTIQEAVTTPAGDVAFSTTVAIDDDAEGTTYTFTAASPSVLTPTTAGALVNVPSVKWLAVPGTIQALGSAAQSGVIEWSMSYIPLSPSAVVTTAA
jgi:hypothetical protein